MNFWCGSAWLPGGLAHDVRITTHGGRIAGVETGAQPGEGDTVLPGFVTPGARNAHSHAFHRALRGRTHGEGGTFWTWREHMYALAAALSPELYRRLARAVYAEMVVAGFTGVGEFHYLHHAPGGRPYPSHDMERALAGAAEEAGIRLTLLDACYLRAGMEPGARLAPEQERFSDGAVDAWRARHESLRAALGERARLGTAIHSVRAVAADDLPAFADLLGSEPVHIHLSEQPAENDAALAAHGVTPTGLLARAGLLPPESGGLTAVHATHLTGGDVAALGAAGAGIVMCPTTEADLADGIGPARALADAGASISLGTDQHAAIDPLLEARGLEAGERLASGERGRFSSAELLGALGPAGARALGEAPGDGTLAPGAVADLVELDTGSTRTAGSRGEQVVLAATAADVRTVVVGGRVVARDGRHESLGDPADLYRAVFEEVDAAVRRGQ